MNDKDEAYDYKFVKWMIKEKVIHNSLSLKMISKNVYNTYYIIMIVMHI